MRRQSTSPILDETYKVYLNRPFFLKGVARFRAYGGGLDDTQAEDWEEAAKLMPPPQGLGASPSLGFTHSAT